MKLKPGGKRTDNKGVERDNPTPPFGPYIVRTMLVLSQRRAPPENRKT